MFQDGADIVLCDFFGDGKFDGIYYYGVRLELYTSFVHDDEEELV